MFFRHHLLAHLAGQLLAAPTVAQRDGDGALGLLLADDVAVELGNDLAGEKSGHVLCCTRAWRGGRRLRTDVGRVRPTIKPRMRCQPAPNRNDQHADHHQQEGEGRNAGRLGRRVEQVVDAERTEIGERRDQERSPVDDERDIDKAQDQQGQHHYCIAARLDAAEEGILPGGP